jgi:hypothetical protein
VHKKLINLAIWIFFAGMIGLMFCASILAWPRKKIRERSLIHNRDVPTQREARYPLLAPPEFGLVDLQQRGEPFMDLIKQFDWASHFDVSFFPGDCAT